MTSRVRNYFFCRNRAGQDEELPWVRIPGLEKLTLPKPVVLINGCFDLLHSAHMRLIFAAREKAGERGTLVCGMDSDRLVMEKKGAARPIMTYIERATALGFMPIDYLVEIDSDEDMTALIEAIHPDLRVQGSDHREHQSRFPWVKKMFISARGLRTSDIINRINERTNQ